MDSQAATRPYVPRTGGGGPTFDPALVKDDVIEIGVQVNGKVRGSLSLPVDASEELALEGARATPNVATHLEGKTVKKIVYVPGKILNIIVAG